MKAMAEKPECVFCEIASGRASAEIVYADGSTLAFLPLRLQAYGHTLIAPRRHAATIWEMTDGELGALMRVVRELSQHWRRTIGATGLNVLHASGADAGQSVAHAHLHLLPRFAGDGLDAWPQLSTLEVDRVEIARRLRLD